MRIHVQIAAMQEAAAAASTPLSREAGRPFHSSKPSVSLNDPNGDISADILSVGNSGLSQSEAEGIYLFFLGEMFAYRNANNSDTAVDQAQKLLPYRESLAAVLVS